MAHHFDDFLPHSLTSTNMLCTKYDQLAMLRSIWALSFLSVIKMKRRDDERVIGTVDPTWWDSGYLGIGHVESARVGEGVQADHITTHVVGPLYHLGTDVHKKCLG
jgi:hypothetical protein